jgi:catechol-2,3-dioxygenase
MPRGDLARWLARGEEQGPPPASPITRQRVRLSRRPEGNGIEVYADRSPKPKWMAAGRDGN